MTDIAPRSPQLASSPERPIGELALALSGGGYRAAAFHLGMLRFLHQVELLDSVTALSTVSGGTILGGAWTLSRMKGEQFSTFDARFSGALQKTNVISLALDNLTKHREHGHPSRPSLIRSAANVYTQPDFVGPHRFGEMLERSQFPFREVIFNSTEFETGVDFRFRRSDNPNATIGNGSVRLPRPVAEHVRLADIVAASSCFPGGFEPLQFPADFEWPQDFPLEKVQQSLPKSFNSSLPLMDGGIYDNQGVDALLLAFQKDEAPPTLLISDVSAKERPLYAFPPAGRRGFLTLRGVTWIGRALFVTALASMIALLTHGWSTARDGDWRLVDYFLYLVPGLFSAAVAGALGYSSVMMREVQEKVRQMAQVDDLWDDLRALTVREAIGLLELRVGSVLALTSKVFMKRIRDLIMGDVFRNPTYQGRRIDNLIYDLQDQPKGLFEKHPWLRPSSELVDLSRQAEKYPTTLWLQDPGKDLELLTRAGAATTCFNLLKHLLEDRASQVETNGSPVQRLYQRLREQWEQFNAPARAGVAPPPAQETPAAAAAQVA